MDSARLTLPPRLDAFPVILFGLECQATGIVLSELLAAGANVNLVCLPGRPSIPFFRAGQRRTLPTLPMGGSQPDSLSVSEIAHSAGVEVWRVGDLDAAETRQALASVPADLVIVACFDRLLPPAVYEPRRFGGVNVHPSLLPDKRGPDPLFWVFRQGDKRAGSTIHRLSNEFDAGDILAQGSIPKPNGISERELDGMLARLGARLLLETISVMSAGGELETRPQDADAASWAPYPARSDYEIDQSMPARLAFNFVRGVSGRAHPVTLKTGRDSYTVREVHGWQGGDGNPPSADAPVHAIEFSDGWLLATLDGEIASQDDPAIG